MASSLFHKRTTEFSEEKTSHNQYVDSELMLPKMPSLVIILLANMFMQISFFIIVSSSNEYAKHLGGTSTFSGVVIGIPTVFSGLTLIPLTLFKYDKGGYKIPLHLCCFTLFLGLVLYALAYHFNFLYLILIGRCVNGVGFSMWMYCKRYCSDPRIVGLRRRTTLASWLVVGNGVGMGIGPLLGGVFFRYVGFGYEGTSKGSLWNGYTSPAWVLAGVWLIYWISCLIWFEDVPRGEPVNEAVIQSAEVSGVSSKETSVTTTTAISAPPPSTNPISRHVMSSRSPESPVAPASPANPDTEPLPRSRYPVIFCMCWFAMTCFFVLGAWESNLPVYTSVEVNPAFGFSPFVAGGFLSVGALICFPFFILNIFLAKRVQDRWTLVAGTFLGASALVILLVLLGLNRTTAGGVSNDTPASLNISALAYLSNTTLPTHIYVSDIDNSVQVPALGISTAPLLFISWFLVALGFNIASTVTMSLLSKTLPSTPKWNALSSVMIQCSNYTGRVTGAVWGGYGGGIGGFGSTDGVVLSAEAVRKAMMSYVGLELALVGIGGVICGCVWKELKAKTG
ncbi:hypothetical protein VKT23_015868 [Stygiomarasmius scandens]|uniref:MFS general substrate transporter n=1 Tax=Marasmiellus scandens TaxID=2682957 RepID=A0ABR1IS72_9AGAR